MAQVISFELPMAVLAKLKKEAREYSGDESLGMNQACVVLLEAIAQGEFARVQKKTKTEQKTE